MTFKEAAKFVLPYGKHSGDTIDKVAETHEGLLYLDWLRGQTLRAKLLKAINRYLSEPVLARELSAALEEKDYDLDLGDA